MNLIREVYDQMTKYYNYRGKELFNKKRLNLIPKPNKRK